MCFSTSRKNLGEEEEEKEEREKKRHRWSDAGGAYKKRLNDLTGLVTRGNRFYSEMDRPSDRSNQLKSWTRMEG